MMHDVTIAPKYHKLETFSENSTLPTKPVATKLTAVDIAVTINVEFSFSRADKKQAIMRAFDPIIIAKTIALQTNPIKIQ